MTADTTSLDVFGLAEKWTVWPAAKKTGIVTPELQAQYDLFKSKHGVQREKWHREVVSPMTGSVKSDIDDFLAASGLAADWQETGRLSYLPSFEPIKSNLSVCYVRHGKTEGNTEPRVFQGHVDYPENQLSSVGKKQAVDAAELQESLFASGQFVPDLVAVSPLGRAIETSLPFLRMHPELPVVVMEDAGEMRFGAWDNVQLRHFDEESICHLFYLDQNVLVKCPTTHLGPDGKAIHPENFVDVLRRQIRLVRKLEELEICQKIIKEGRSPKVLIYGHSMSGGALSILLGRGKKLVGSENQIGFDSEYIMPNAQPNILTPRKIPFVDNDAAS